MIENQILLSPLSPEQLTDIISTTVRSELERKRSEETRFLSREKIRHMFTPAVSIQTVRNWEKRGLITPKQIEGLVFFDRDEILAAVQNIHRYDRKKSNV